MSLVLNALVPLGSVLLGAALTYWLNVRSKRRSYVEDLFNQAITAVAVADASRHYLGQLSHPPTELGADEYRQLLAQIARVAIENHFHRTGEAREALGRVLQYEPAIRAYYQDAEAVTRQPDDIIALLTSTRDRLLTSRRHPRRPARPQHTP